MIEYDGRAELPMSKYGRQGFVIVAGITEAQLGVSEIVNLIALLRESRCSNASQ